MQRSSKLGLRCWPLGAQSFLLRQDGLVSFALSLLELLLGMLPLVLLPPLDCLELFLFDLAGLLHNLGDMSVSPDASDLGLCYSLVSILCIAA